MGKRLISQNIIRVGVNVLVVDDDRLLRETFSSLLREEGYTVKSASSGERALDLLRKERFDMVFVDLKMPRMDGIELITRVREEGIDTIPIMITGYASVESAVEAMKHGAYDYIEKPFEMERIRQVIDDAIRERDFKMHVSAAIERMDPFTTLADLTRSMPGLLLTSVSKMKEREGQNLKCIYVSGDGGDVHPRDLYRINDVVRIFARNNPRSAVCIHCLSALLGAHSWSDVFTFLTKLIEDLSPRGVKFIIAIDSTDIRKEYLQDLVHLITEKHIQPISDCLSNPIRRSIIRILKKLRRAHFSSIMQEVGEIDSPKLSFHLRKLLNDGVICKENDEYTLTPGGSIIAETLDTLEYGLASDLQNTIALFYGY